MAPTAAMALNGVAPAGPIGRAVALAVPFAAIAIALISRHASCSRSGGTASSRAGGAAKFLHLERREPRWRVVIVALATAAIVYTFYKQVWPKPPYPYDIFPLLIGGWAVLGAAITLAFPALTRRIGRGLSEAEGIVGPG